MACAVTSSNLQKEKKKVRLVSIWLKLTVQKKRQKLIESDLTSYSTWIHRFQIHLQETDLTIKKSKQQHCYTELLEKSGDDYPQEWPPCYRPKTVGKLFKLFGELPLQPKPLVSTLQTDQFTLQVGLILLLGLRRHIFIFLLL